VSIVPCFNHLRIFCAKALLSDTCSVRRAMHLAESAAPSDSSLLHYSMNFGVEFNKQLAGGL